MGRAEVEADEPSRPRMLTTWGRQAVTVQSIGVLLSEVNRFSLLRLIHR
jgi:hypothetical protein